MPYHLLQNLGLLIIALMMMLFAGLTYHYGAETEAYMQEINSRHSEDLRSFRKLSNQINELNRLFSIDKSTELISLDQALQVLDNLLDFLRSDTFQQSLTARPEANREIRENVQNLQSLLRLRSQSLSAEVDFDRQEIDRKINQLLNQVRSSATGLLDLLPEASQKVRIQLLISASSTIINRYTNQPRLHQDEVLSLSNSIEQQIASMRESDDGIFHQDYARIEEELRGIDLLINSTYLGWKSDRTLSTLHEDETYLVEKITLLTQDINRLITLKDQLIRERSNQVITATHNIRNSMTTLALAGVFITLIGLMLLRSGLKSRLRTLTQATESMHNGELDARARIEHADDFGRLATSFNGMAEALQQKHQLLDQVNHDLEQKVRQRTQRLMSTIDQLEEEVTARKQVESRLEQIAFYDQVTKLPNRSLFRERLAVEINNALRNGEQLTLCFVDLDKFKEINDTLGHAAGDLLLNQVARRIENVTRRKTDLVARLGGDEFVIVFEGCTSDSTLLHLIEDLITELSLPFTINGSEALISASVGIAICPHDGANYETLMRHADLAMYQAKAKGKNTYHFYDPSLNARLMERIEMEQALRHAIEHHEFEVFYQPKVDMQSHTIVGAEALVRWRHPDGRLVPPDSFIPLAEETGLIIPIGWQVLYQALDQQQKFRKKLGVEIPISINISARQFHNEELAQKIADAIEQRGIDPRMIEIELTESAAMEDANYTQQALKQLKELGVQISLDDFGTGYSSLAYLKRFPINKLKIDRGFINELESDSDDRSIVQSIISLARSLDTGIIAEGVENRVHVRTLLELGCNDCQGYFYSPPVSSEKFEHLLIEMQNQPNPR